MVYQRQKFLGTWQGRPGGYSFLGFSKKDAYNFIDRSKHGKIADGDSNATIGYLEGKAALDPMCMAKYELSDDNVLGNLFWADGGSRIDFQYFGDVLAFDSTYKKNKYRRPLVIFSGSNNHKQTTIFGFGLVKDETVGSYKWLLETFLEVMCQRKPSVVVTDGCESMRGAIRAIFPEATHRLCAWHMQKNVTANVKEEGLRELFNRWLYADMEEEVFEAEWEAAILDYGKLDTFWYNDTYDKRKMWDNAYLRDKFCAGFKTTSRCEGINANVKRFLKSRQSILEMVQNLELVVREYRNNELLSQFKSTHGFPVLTTGLEPLERHAANVYTWEVFFDVRKEIEGVSRVIYVSKNRVSTTMVYTVGDYGEPGRNIRVLYDRDGKRFDCPCNLWKKKGFPCRHMFFVMKYEHLMEIPESLILNRWCKDAKSVERYVETSSDGSERAFLLRHGALHSATQWLVYVGAKSHTIFSRAISGLKKLSEELDGLCDEKGEPKEEHPETKAAVKDPDIVKTKGAPRIPKKERGRKRKCTNCRNPGHTKRHCTKRAADESEDELASQGSSPTDQKGGEWLRKLEEETWSAGEVGVSRAYRNRVLGARMALAKQSHPNTLIFKKTNLFFTGIMTIL